jgi:hypothetical protein
MRKLLLIIISPFFVLTAYKKKDDKLSPPPLRLTAIFNSYINLAATQLLCQIKKMVVNTQRILIMEFMSNQKIDFRFYVNKAVPNSNLTLTLIFFKNATIRN